MNNYSWNLDKIYKGYDEEYKENFNKVKEIIDKINKVDFNKRCSIDVFKEGFKLEVEATKLFESMFGYSQLRLATNSEDLEALKQLGALEAVAQESVGAELKLKKYSQDYPTFLEDALKDEYLKQFKYVLEKMVDDSKRLLSDETEIMLSKLNKSGGSAWERMFESLTSTLEVDYKGEIITLPMVRNLAYSSDSKERKEAYEAELKSYKKIEKSIAQSLSSIKQQVSTISEARGFESPIDQTLSQTGMTKKTLDALISAIEDYLPWFRKYLRRKGEVLGYKNGLPFYELFAPMGSSNKEYTIESANHYLVQTFSKFNTEISSMMQKAMDNNWIDYLPKKGKVGGAFCSSQFKAKESRILTNFDGSFGSVVTLAHELGHAFHSEQLWNEEILNCDYPMQLAETASTFNETYIKNQAFKEASSKDEKLFILENWIADDNQVIVDILSRYYFELSVFEKSKDSALTPEELCELMKDAQMRSYGDGLDPNYMHPYMWCCKSHYYSTGLSFYNFPYAFGQLFAYGLYSIYEEKGDEFFTLYKRILKDAGRMPIRECVLQAGIDVEDKSFWVKSLDLIKEKIEKFLSLTE